MLSFERVGELLDAIAEEFPPEFFEDLNGGISLLPQAKRNPRGAGLYIMGEYCHDQMGRYINLYYGSFSKVLGDAPEEDWDEELYATLAHEFTHHLEGLAGERGLEVKDEEFLRRHLGGEEEDGGGGETRPSEPRKR